MIGTCAALVTTQLVAVHAGRDAPDAARLRRGARRHDGVRRSGSSRASSCRSRRRGICRIRTQRPGTSSGMRSRAPCNTELPDVASPSSIAAQSRARPHQRPRIERASPLPCRVRCERREDRLSDTLSSLSDAGSPAALNSLTQPVGERVARGIACSNSGGPHQLTVAVADDRRVPPHDVRQHDRDRDAVRRAVARGQRIGAGVRRAEHRLFDRGAGVVARRAASPPAARDRRARPARARSGRRAAARPRARRDPTRVCACVVTNDSTACEIASMPVTAVSDARLRDGQRRIENHGPKHRLRDRRTPSSRASRHRR